MAISDREMMIDQGITGYRIFRQFHVFRLIGQHPGGYVFCIKSILQIDCTPAVCVQN